MSGGTSVNFEFTDEKRGDPPGFRFGLNTTRANQLPQKNAAEPKEFAARSPNAANSSTTTRGRVTTTELYRRAVNGKRECAPQFSGLRATVLGLLQWFSFETSFRGR